MKSRLGHKSHVNSYSNNKFYYSAGFCRYRIYCLSLFQRFCLANSPRYAIILKSLKMHIEKARLPVITDTEKASQNRI